MPQFPYYLDLVPVGRFTTMAALVPKNSTLFKVL